jgi:hypothetical protein
MNEDYKYTLDDDGSICAQLPDGTDFPLYDLACPKGYFCQTYKRSEVEPVLKIIKGFWDKRYDFTLEELERIAKEAPKKNTDWCRRQLIQLVDDLEDFEG